MQGHSGNSHVCSCGGHLQAGLSRRGFLGGVGATVGAASLINAAVSAAPATQGASLLPKGKALRVQPVLTYVEATRQEKTSWRSYGAIQSLQDAEQEAVRIRAELETLAERAEFPTEFLPLLMLGNDTQVRQAAATDADALLVFAANGPTNWFQTLAASKTPNIMFIRHKSGAYYFWHEVAHWRLLRADEDAMVEPNMDVDDIVVDEYGEVLWRLRALYGLKNARGTKMLAVESLAAYSKPAQELGPKHAQDVWGYTIELVPYTDFSARLAAVRNDAKAMSAVTEEMNAFLARPNLALQTEKRFVENTFVALRVCRELLAEKQAFNIAFDHCMGKQIIEMLDTPPCLLEALINDEGFTSYCHTDLSHTVTGVLMRWIAGTPTLVCNTHFPHDGIFTIAHCAAPTRMNGREPDPTTVMTHYESDYGAATKIEYPQGQELTVVMPNLHLTRWHGFKGTVLDCPSLPACRSQMNIQIAGDWRQLVKDMEGFHAQIVYGDYLREIGYALKKLKAIEWRNYSAV